MDRRLLGNTGVSVSPLCLGAMMFGSWGNTDRATRCGSSTRPSTRASTSSTRPTSTRSGESEEIVGRRSRGRREQSCWRESSTAAMGDGRQRTRQLAALDHPRGRGQPAPAAGPTGSTSTRSTAPNRRPTSRRRWRRSRTSYVRARSATSAAPPSRPRTSSRPSGCRATRHCSGSCASSRRIRCSCAASRPTSAHRQRHGMGVITVEPAGRRLAVGRLAQGPGSRRSPAPDGCRRRYDLSSRPTSASSRPPMQLAGLADESGIS